MSEGKSVSKRSLRRRVIKTSGEAGAPGPDNTSEDGGKRKGRDEEITRSSSEQVC
jgi:hypothetical protein